MRYIDFFSCLPLQSSPSFRSSESCCLFKLGLYFHSVKSLSGYLVSAENKNLVRLRVSPGFSLPVSQLMQ